ncbi:hypothetical protein pb186bvf_020725 [Paramecium bursaria]
MTHQYYLRISLNCLEMNKYKRSIKISKCLQDRKQNGQIIDTNSERSLIKNLGWNIVGTFQCWRSNWNPNLSVKVEAKDPKQKEPPKKAAAPGKNDPAPLPVTNTTMAMKSFKTFRQKSAKHHLHSAINQFVEELKKQVLQAQQQTKVQRERELKFQFKWEQSINSL